MFQECDFEGRATLDPVQLAASPLAACFNSGSLDQHLVYTGIKTNDRYVSLLVAGWRAKTLPLTVPPTGVIQLSLEEVADSEEGPLISSSVQFTSIFPLSTLVFSTIVFNPTSTTLTLYWLCGASALKLAHVAEENRGRAWYSPNHVNGFSG